MHIKDIESHIGKEISISGFVDVRRDHGKLIFIDLRDETGKVQMVALPEHTEAHEYAEKLRPEWVITVTGMVNDRPERMRKEGINGSVEIEVRGITVLAEAETPVFDVGQDTRMIDEEVRLKYRPLDLRSVRMQKNIRLRSDWVHACRNYLDEHDFTEIETPLLSKATAEGSRDFIVPSRLHPGEFYALPQSPQQYKQLLMVGGFERYYQLARALRDEDLRADRGFEHTQIDIEMAYTNSETIRNLVEEMLIKSAESLGYTIKEKPFPRIPYTEAMEKYGSDKFDMRTDAEKEANILAYAWVVNFPFFEKNDSGGLNPDGSPSWTFTHNPFSMPKEEYIQDLLEGKNIENIIADQFDLVCNGFEVGGGSMRAHKPDILKATYKVFGYSEEEIQNSIGHILEAFSFGVPPHGGIALGVERNIMILAQEEALREVQAFPMTAGGKTSVMNAPNTLPPEDLLTFGISVKKK